MFLKPFVFQFLNASLTVPSCCFLVHYQALRVDLHDAPGVLFDCRITLVTQQIFTQRNSPVGILHPALDENVAQKQTNKKYKCVVMKHGLLSKGKTEIFQDCSLYQIVYYPQQPESFKHCKNTKYYPVCLCNF